MSKYLETITEALIAVLNQAARSVDHRGALLRDHRILGYAANVDFWVGEIDHCLVALDGFPERQQAFSTAMRQAIEETREATGYAESFRGSGPLNLYYGESPTSAQFEQYLVRVTELRRRLVEASRKLLGRLRSADLVSHEKWSEIQERLALGSEGAEK
jgi:hypothetical protein